MTYYRVALFSNPHSSNSSNAWHLNSNGYVNNGNNVTNANGVRADLYIMRFY